VRVNVVGYVFVGLVALGFCGALVVVARSFPDIHRYVKMRRM
jgi:hypothetical protein